MCFVFIWEQTATCATYSINWFVFITEMKSVYCAVRTGSLNKAVCPSSLKVCFKMPVYYQYLQPCRKPKMQLKICEYNLVDHLWEMSNVMNFLDSLRNNFSFILFSLSWTCWNVRVSSTEWCTSYLTLESLCVNWNLWAKYLTLLFIWGFQCVLLGAFRKTAKNDH